MRRRAGAHRLIVGLLVFVTLAAAACSGDDDGDDAGSNGEGSSQRDEYVEAFLSTANDPELSEEDNRCLAEALVDGIGVDQLRDAATPDEIRGSEDFRFADLGIELSDAQRDGFYEQLSDCVDLHELLVSSWTQGGDEAVVDCVDGELTDDQVRTVVVATYLEDEATSGETVQDVLSDLYMDCVATLPSD